MFYIVYVALSRGWAVGPSFLTQCCVFICRYAAMGTAAKYLINPHKMDDANKKEVLDVIGLASSVAKKGFKL